MHNYSSLEYGPFQTAVRVKRSDGSSSSSFNNRYNRRAIVSSGPVLQGNHESENPWNYNIERGIRLSGDARDYSALYEFYTSGNIDTSPNSSFMRPPAEYFATPQGQYNDLVERLNEKVRGGVDLSVDIAQAGQVRKMLSASDRVTQVARAVNRRGRGAIRLISSLWLEYQYAWRPAVSTMYEAGYHIAGWTQRPKMVSVRTGTSTSFDVEAGTVDVYRYGPDIPWRSKGEAFHGQEMRIYLKANSPGLGGYTSLNPLSLAWELLPYSFVVDWFYNIGGYIRGWETAMLYDSSFLYGTKATLRVIEAQNSLIHEKNSWSRAVAEGYYRSKTFNRQLLSNYPIPARPVLRADLGSSRLLNAAALLGNLLGGGPDNKTPVRPRRRRRGTGFQIPEGYAL